jgi:pimeloyl-ACP methyl ester carboxylesterase
MGVFTIQGNTYTQGQTTMNLIPRNSMLNGDLHRQNIELLQASAVSTTLLGMRARAPGIFDGTEGFNQVLSGPVIPRATFIADRPRNALVILLNGMEGFDKVSACITGWIDDGSSVAANCSPYGLAATMLLPFIPNPNPGPGWQFVRIIGHSYGGAVGVWLAKQFPNLANFNTLELYTYGSPKPSRGDFGAGRVDSETVRVFNVLDPVPRLPYSSLRDHGQLWEIVGVPTARGWSRWFQTSTGFAVDSTGAMYQQEVPNPQNPVAFYLTLAAYLSSNVAFGNDNHSLASYASLLASTPGVAVQQSFPRSSHTHTDSSRPTTNELNLDRAEALAIAGGATNADPAGALQGILSGTQLIEGERFHGTQSDGYQRVVYNGEIVATVATRRLRRALVRRLNRTFRG